MEGLKSYLEKTISRIPNLGIHFCENRAADSVIGYYCALAKREGIPFCAKLDLPQTLPVDEINMCLVLSNLLENALEASIRTAPDRRQIKITAYLHAGRLLLIEVRMPMTAKSGRRTVFLILQTKGKRRRHPVYPTYCRKKRRCKYVYLSEGCFFR